MVFSNRRKEVFHVPASREMTAGDFVRILLRLFKLPKAISYSEDGCSVSLSYSLLINEKKLPLDHRFADIGVEAGPAVTIWKTMVFRDEDGSTREDVIEMITIGSIARRMRTKRQRFADAKYKYVRAMNEAFDAAIMQIVRDPT